MHIYIKQTVPHYYLTVDLNLDALLDIRAKLNADLPAEQQLSLNDMLLKAAALACRTVSAQTPVLLTNMLITASICVPHCAIV
jgi:pyruvate/2-oxoglutarate dehydrogenase complex dihydrolipoamide acyltransferase (E2) component